jgi:outer membrane protein OmpA-like peptidoglycan-associated protein
VAGDGVETATPLQPPRLPGSLTESPTGPGGIVYEKGRGPRALSAAGEKEGGAATSTSFDESKSSFMAGTADSSFHAEAPKATDLKEAPVSLDQMASQFGKESKPDAKAKNESASESIFGPAVSDKAPEKAAKSCESKVTPWTRECGDSGYPPTYTGKIVGETRVECPSGDMQDVWLSNTCAPSAAASAAEVAAREQRATDVKDAPKSLAESSIDASAAQTTSAPASIPGARVDANCGAANGSAVAAKPFDDLCASGQPTAISGEGPWRWSCQGANGGMTVSCAAPVARTEAKTPEKATAGSGLAAKTAAAEDGKCGSADGTGTDIAPAAMLCSKGIASRVNGGGPWTWACSGTNGGQAAACSAPRKVDGACGAAGDGGVTSMPERDLCSSGYASAVTGEGPWNWTCSGLYGGSAATCSAMPRGNAVCGSASLSGHNEAPTDGLCKIGEASAVEGSGPWTWTCGGTHGGATVSCKAAIMADGQCGSANGGSFEKAPVEGLCAQGNASRITGHGPWNWNCSGLEGGSTVGCTASLGAKEKNVSKSIACGTAAEAAAFQIPTQNLCAGGKASSVTGNGPWSWSCSDDEGHTVACTTLMATEGTCGTAANVPSPDAPSNDLCATGEPGRVTPDKGKKNWSWECKGSMGAATVSCSAPVLKTAADSEDAKCGAASGRAVSEAPKGEMCAAGKSSALRGKGPWTWTCGAKSGRKVECEALKITDGACGPVNGSMQKELPQSGLCSDGTPTEVSGAGPWLWSCVGEGGGSSVSCSAAAQAQARIDGSCGAAANAIMTHAPDNNLCDTGGPSTVYGEGPWTWTCSGFNGGIASTCSTSKVMPKAPPPPGPLVNGNCGPANGVAAVVSPKEGLCSSGTVTDISGHGPWNWNCLGDNGGMTVSCTAPLMPPAPIEGVCGPANGVTTLTRPSSALCSAGIASAVSGKGPWTWSCSGTNGGGAVSCVAPLAGKGGSARPLPSTVTPSSGERDEAPVPSAAPVGLVTPKLPAGPLPPFQSGALPQLKPSKPLDIPTEASAMTQSGLPGFPSAPSAAPDLPEGTEPLVPPPMRDMVKPSTSLKPPAIDQEGKLWPGAKLVLDSDISSLSFDQGASDIGKDIASTLDKLASVLQKNGGARITLNAYAGTNGDITPREARRVSLARALAVRDYLTSKGISSGRIDVRALGANVPSGDMDRVDVKVN